MNAHLGISQVSADIDNLDGYATEDEALNGTL